MKLVKNFVFAVLLVSTLTFNTVAGEMQLPGSKPSATPPTLTAETDDGSLTPVSSTDTQQTEVETSDYLLYEAWLALLSMY